MAENIFKPSFIEAAIYLSRRYNYGSGLQIDDLIDASSEIMQNEYDYLGVKKFLNEYELTLDFFSIRDEDIFQDDISKNILYKLIQLINPIWTEVAFNGVEHVINQIKILEDGTDILQCLKNAGLLGDLTGDTARWWLRIMQDSRPDDSNLLDIGTEGEDQTIHYEKTILQKLEIDENKIVNMALSYPDEKYDVLSFRTDDKKNNYTIQIESKKTKRNHFFLSRGEYEAGKKFQETYRIYYWESDDQLVPKIMSFENLQKHIPKDEGNGTWTNVEIKPTDSDFINLNSNQF